MRGLILSVLTVGLFSCQKSATDKVEVVTTLPKLIKEASAAEISKASDLIWTIEDQKNENILFGFTTKGELKKEIRISNVENNDWEDLSSDDAGNIYVGDFGNNDNLRENLAIYKINAADLSKNEAKATAIVEFFYPEQTEFPPKKKDRVFDVESFFILNNQFYLFTKNRSSKFDGTTVLYRVENKSGQKLPAQKISSFVTCGNFNQCAVTSAAISPDKKKVALLSSDKVWIFTDFKGDDFFSGKSQMIELGHFSQKEGLTFENNDSILITDEAQKKGESFLYRLKLNK
ncbi:hypothetical protein G6R40_04565 [Chryseobacterium sp. POL2]|uniref:hypothetical protein n=1 Tax=Chryseobacterium sp. POL2 TaxID=2713414 RepID=UPI0013E139EB|nr:hypothetical protein [Chryseobacterium sp. POL2]QIG88983.1 hypothetical protein G6R40_04565 [Chryseobacterium sp. POL2]